MARILIVTDSAEIESDVSSMLASDNHVLAACDAGRKVRAAVADFTPDLLILDSQIGSMGAIAVCLDLHLEATAGRLDPAKVLLLLDRRADVFTAKRSGADGFLIKPLNAILLRRAVSEILVGNLFVDNSYKPLDGLSSVSTRLPSTL